MNKIPTYEECLSICERETAFSHSTQELKGKVVESFKYNVQKYFNEMYAPFLEEGINALALRGITFIDRTLVALGPDKFFNVGENETATYPEEVVGILEKIDGSLIQVFSLNGELEVKTQKSVYSDVANDCREYFKTKKDIQSLCEQLLVHNLSPFFEYVSPSNRIVIDYDKTDMYFLGARDMTTGETKYPWQLFISQHISTPRLLKDEELDEYLKREDVEGVVVIGKDHLVKMKTETYCSLHRILEIKSNKHMCEHYQLKGSFDDVIGVLSRYNLPNDIERMKNFEVDYLRRYDEIMLDVKDLCVKYTGTRKDIAIAMVADKIAPKMRSMVFSTLDGKDLQPVTERILYEHYRGLDK